MKTLKSRKRRRKLLEAADWKPLSIIFLIVTLPMAGLITLLIVSLRPSLSERTFSRALDREDVSIVDWPKLYSFCGRTPEAEKRLKSVADSTVFVPGYMVSFEQSPDRDGRVGEFLLVPDPGTYLHPPHMDSGEVVLVRMTGALRTPLLSRIPVWVEGRLSPHLVNRGDVEGAFELIASSVSEMKDVRN